MNTKSLMWLGAVTVLVAGVAAMTLKSREASVTATGANQKLFPDLLSSVNDVATISIKKKDGECTLQKSGDGWVAVDKKGYRVDVEPVRKTLIGLTEATLIEEKTSDKTRYAKLGVQDPSESSSADAGAAAPEVPVPGADPHAHAADPTAAAAATPTLITLKDAGGKVLASLIVGKAHEGKSFGTNQVYVRRAGEERSYLAKASLELKDKAVDWLDKKILEIKRDRIRSVEVKHPDGEIVHVEREKPEDTNFALRAIPEGKELTFPTAASGMGSSLEWLNLEDVVPAAEIDFTSSPVPVCRFTTFDGLTITVTTKDENEKTYARFEAAYEAPPDAAPKSPETPPTPDEKKDVAGADKKSEKKTPEEVQKEVAELNARLTPWVFVIPSYNKATFTKHMADLVKDKAPPPPPPGSDGAATPSDTESYKIPDNLPPEIQKQIEADLKAKGHKTELVPAAKPGDAKPPESNPPGSTPPDSTPPAPKPDESKPPESKGEDEKPKEEPKPPQQS